MRIHALYTHVGNETKLSTSFEDGRNYGGGGGRERKEFANQCPI